MIFELENVFRTQQKIEKGGEVDGEGFSSRSRPWR
jgi:hypothetical protein